MFDFDASMGVMSSLYGSSAPFFSYIIPTLSQYPMSVERYFMQLVGVGGIVQLSQSINSTLPHCFPTVCERSGV